MGADGSRLDRLESWLLSIQERWSSDSPLESIKMFPVKLLIEGGVGFVLAFIISATVFPITEVTRLYQTVTFIPQLDSALTVTLGMGIFFTGLAFCNLIKHVDG